MNVVEAVVDIVAQLRDAEQTVQGEWYFSEHDDCVAHLEGFGGYDLLVIEYRLTSRNGLRVSRDVDWDSHPAAWLMEDNLGEEPPSIGLAPWVLEDGALEAVVAANIDPEYARGAHCVGIADPWQLIEAWRSGIPVEYLGVLGGAA